MTGWFFRVGALCLTALTLGCAPIPEPETPQRRATPTEALPPMKTFSSVNVARPRRPNAQIAADFLDLSFRMESGRELPILTRFDGTVTVGVRGNAPPSLTSDLTRLLNRLRREAGIDIRAARPGEPVSITVEVLARRELQRVVPQAACFVVPRVSSWAEFRRNRRSDVVDWTTLTERRRAAVFLPGDVSPQEVRDCLHEEIAQALGPLNDLYRLPDSVFNDDNFHTVLTGFDMLILRAYYDPALANGMSRAQVARALPGVLARLNPGGAGLRARPVAETSRGWIEAIETALGPRTSASGRRTAAKRAVALAEAAGWNDNRTAFSLYALGRLSLSREPDLALASFLQSAAIFRSRPETRVQAAHVNMQLAAFSLSSGQLDGTLALVQDSLPAVRQAENAALLSTLLLIRAEALDLKGATTEARRVRNEALGWARYGFGSDAIVRARLSEIAALAPRQPAG